MAALRTILKVLGWIYVAYLGISLLVLLPAMNFLAPRYFHDYTGRELRTELILFDPFSLALEVRGAEVPEPDGERFLGFRRAAVNLSLASLFRPGVVLDEVALEQLYLHVRREADGSYNFSDMIPPDDGSPAPEDSEPAALPPVTIDSLRLQAERILVSDMNPARDEPFSTHWDDLDIAVSGLSTVIEEGHPYRLEAASEAGGRLSWEGEVSLVRAYSEGSLRIENIDLRVPWRFARPWLNFELADGRLAIAGDYRVSWEDSLDYQVSSGSSALTGLALTPLDPALGDTHLRLGELQLSDIAVDGAATSVAIGGVATRGLDVAGWSEGERISLAEMLAPVPGDAAAGPATPPPPSAPAPGATPEGDTAAATPAGGAAAGQDPETAWRIALGGLTLGDSALAWRSEYTDPPTLRVSPLELEVGAVSWPPEGNTPLSLALTLNDATTLGADGELALGPGDGRFDYRLEGLQLPWFSPAIPDAFNAELTGGALTLSGDVTLAGFEPVVLRQDGEVADFAGVLRGEEDSFTGWDSVSWRALAVDFEQRAVALERVAIRGYRGRLHIYEDGSINAQRVLEQEIAEAEAEAEARADAAGEAPPAEDAGEPWSYRVPLITIDNSAVDFMDESMPIVFRTVIGELHGEIEGLGSAVGSEARVDLEGSVDGYAPVTFGGTVRPADDPLALDLGLTFDGLDLVRLTPYSGTYAGYAIDRGTMNLDVRYSVEQGRLQGANRLRIDQLKLGDKVESEKAANLPLPLAVALLTDASGVIDLDVPVNGSLDDPGFSLGGVIAKAFVNLITKAATAPFKLLASLVGSDSDLQRISFAAGSSELDEVGRKKLSDLASAMAQRPGIKLIVDGRLHPRTDPEYLQEQALDAALLSGGLEQASLAKRGDDWEAAVVARYSERFGEAEDALTVRDQYQRLAAATPVDPAALAALLEARAVSVKRFLVTEGGIAADRAAIGASDPQSEDNTFSGVSLDVGS